MQQRINFTTSKDGWKLAWSAMGSGPPVLYFLGLNHLTRNMEDPAVAAAMGRASAGRTVLRFDLRGSGLSQRGIRALSQSIMCDDIESVLDAAAVERADIVAHGNSCLWVVPFVVSHPERVNRLVLGSPMARWHLPPGLKEALIDLRDSNWETYTETLAALLRPGGLRDVERTSRLMRDALTRQDYSVFVEALHSSSIADVLPRCRTTTLVVRDAGRSMVPGDTATEVASLLPNVRLLTFDTSGPTTQHERLTSEPVLAFLDEGWTDDNGRRSDLPALSAREREVLALVAAGRTDAQIAKALSIAPGTASRHVHSILTKLGAANRAEAAALASRIEN
jgi:pimeloyl-ACP methyl ester carboxylesterase/DNA-binding CsgD family transcriptional regulator